MNLSPASILQLIERRTVLLHALSEALTAASASVVGFDLEGLESRIADQQKLCLEVAALDLQMNELQSRLAKSFSPRISSTPELTLAISRLHEMQARVRFLNQSHQMLLQRSRRTAAALLNSYQSFIAETYEDPASLRTSREAL